MRKFEFRLQSVLVHRERVADEAKQKYREKRTEIHHVENSILQLNARRHEIISKPLAAIAERLMLEAVVFRFDEDEKALKIVLSMLEQEADALRRRWLETRQDARVVDKLKENALSDWQLAFRRHEQSELDEWTNLRRIA